MWFVFPQIAGLGQSKISQQYAISGLDEAKTYRPHAVLGPRLIECTDLVAQTPGNDPEQIFGEIDALKLHSSMTLFLRAAPDQPLFQHVLNQYFDGRPDAATERLVTERADADERD